MRGLSGDLTTMPLKDVVVYLGNRKVSGTLSLDRQGIKKSANLRDGVVVNTSSNEPREYLGQFLINMGQITEDQFNKAYQTQKETRIFLGKILVMTGSVTEEQVRNALSMKFRETLLGAFQWTDGDFFFNPDEMGEALDGVDLGIDLIDIHREGEFRETAWQAIRGVFPTGAIRLDVDESRLPEPPKPGTLDHRLLSMMRDSLTIDDMVLALHATDFFLYQRLYALFRLEAIKVREEGAENAGVAPGMGQTSSVAEIIQHARSFLASGAYSDAEAVAKQAYEMSPTEETQALLSEAEAGLSAELRRALLSIRQIPTLLMPMAKLKQMQLSAPERYLLSKVDGNRDVGGIVHVSPLRELEALKLLQRFVDAGLVSLRSEEGI